MHAEIKTIEREVTVTQEVEMVSLELTKDEAQFLRDITHRIGGNPGTSRRGIADRLAVALTPFTEYPSVKDFNDTGIRSAIYFNDSEVAA